jgi:hypothetical protein
MKEGANEDLAAKNAKGAKHALSEVEGGAKE